MNLWNYCVYTIVAKDKLDEHEGAEFRHSEKKPWVTAHRWVEKAKEKNLAVPILFADACDCSKLIYWGILTRVDLTDEGTKYAVADLRPLKRGKYSPQHLILKNARRPIAPAFIRPYALCEVPEFIFDAGKKKPASSDTNPHNRNVRRNRKGQCASR